MRIRKVFQFFGIVFLSLTIINLFTWLIWGKGKVQKIIASNLTELVYQIPDTVYILNHNSAENDFWENSYNSFSLSEKKEFKKEIAILFYNKPFIEVPINSVKKNGVGISKPVFNFVLIDKIPFYMSIESSVYFGSNSMSNKWTGVWIFKWLISDSYISFSA